MKSGFSYRCTASRHHSSHQDGGVPPECEPQATLSPLQADHSYGAPASPSTEHGQRPLQHSDVSSSKQVSGLRFLMGEWTCLTNFWKISVTWTEEKFGGVMSGFWWVWADKRRHHIHFLSFNHSILLIRHETDTHTVSLEPLRFHQSHPLCQALSTCPKSVCAWETARPAGCPSSSGSYTDCEHAWPPHVWWLHVAGELYLKTVFFKITSLMFAQSLTPQNRTTYEHFLHAHELTKLSTFFRVT